MGTNTPSGNKTGPHVTQNEERNGAGGGTGLYGKRAISIDTLSAGWHTEAPAVPDGNFDAACWNLWANTGDA
jgi:hypothetical protein